MLGSTHLFLQSVGELLEAFFALETLELEAIGAIELIVFTSTIAAQTTGDDVATATQTGTVPKKNTRKTKSKI